MAILDGAILYCGYDLISLRDKKRECINKFYDNESLGGVGDLLDDFTKESRVVDTQDSQVWTC